MRDTWDTSILGVRAPWGSWPTIELYPAFVRAARVKERERESETRGRRSNRGRRGTSRRRDRKAGKRERARGRGDSDRDARDDASSTADRESDEDEDRTLSCERDAGRKFTCTRARIGQRGARAINSHDLSSVRKPFLAAYTYVVCIYRRASRDSRSRKHQPAYAWMRLLSLLRVKGEKQEVAWVSFVPSVF